MKIKVTVLWDITPCSLVDSYLYFKGSCSLLHLPPPLLLDLPFSHCFSSCPLHGMGSSWLARSLRHNPFFSTIFACLIHFYPEHIGSISSEIFSPVYQTTGTGFYFPEVCNLGSGFVCLIARNVCQHNLCSGHLRFKGIR